MRIAVIDLENNNNVQDIILKKGTVITNFLQILDSGLNYQYSFTCLYDEKQTDLVTYHFQIVTNDVNIPNSCNFVGSKYDGSDIKHLIYW